MRHIEEGSLDGCSSITQLYLENSTTYTNTHEARLSPALITNCAVSLYNALIASFIVDLSSIVCDHQDLINWECWGYYDQLRRHETSKGRFSPCCMKIARQRWCKECIRMNGMRKRQGNLEDKPRKRLFGGGQLEGCSNHKPSRNAEGKKPLANLPQGKHSA